MLFSRATLLRLFLFALSTTYVCAAVGSDDNTYEARGVTLEDDAEVREPSIPDDSYLDAREPLSEEDILSRDADIVELLERLVSLADEDQPVERATQAPPSPDHPFPDQPHDPAGHGAHQKHRFTNPDHPKNYPKAFTPVNCHAVTEMLQAYHANKESYRQWKIIYEDGRETGNKKREVLAAEKMQEKKEFSKRLLMALLMQGRIAKTPEGKH